MEVTGPVPASDPIGPGCAVPLKPLARSVTIVPDVSSSGHHATSFGGGVTHGGVRVELGVGVAVGVRVGVGVRVSVRVWVGVLVNVPVGVPLGVRLAVRVAVRVGLNVPVDVAVRVGVLLGRGVAVAVEVGTLVTVTVRVAVAVVVGEWVGGAVGVGVVVGVGVHTAPGHPAVLVAVGEALLGVGLGVRHLPPLAVASAWMSACERTELKTSNSLR